MYKVIDFIILHNAVSHPVRNRTRICMYGMDILQTNIHYLI